MNEDNNKYNGRELPEDDPLHNVKPVSGMYQDWFLDYASYVILERAVPAIEDGFKPVQRRIMHAMKVMDDGRFNKVANIIGATMQYHPHGDASIGDAMVNMGQKDLLIETQGNWGDIRTGDSAAAPRYIEARLSKFALEVVFNPQTTKWQLSYDGRKKEPVTLPVKFPLLLAQGVEGIAVGLSTRVLPHNFNELITASIDILKGKKTGLYPDFPTGGQADFTEYNEGLRGGRVKVRAKIEQIDKKTLIVCDIPFSTTTSGLIESIIKANDKGKIKIKHVVDNTARDVEILITLAPGQSPDITIDALYAFTDCEISISPNACIIVDDKPHFMQVNEILKINTDQTVDLLARELEIRREELMEKILFLSLEKIFIENHIYHDIEECETWESVIDTIDNGLEPFKSDFYREITKDDIVRLTEIKIKRISRYDAFKADEALNRLAAELEEVKNNLADITGYAIRFFKNLIEKYGKGRERKTEIKSFESISATIVAANNAKLYVNRTDGFVGYGLKKDEYIADCSDIDDILVIRTDGKCMVSRISEKMFMGKNIMYAGIWKKGDERMIYNAVYVDGGSGKTRVKRFNVLAITRDKEYDLTKGHNGSKMLYLSANPNGEAEVITVKLTAGCKARKKVFDFDFSMLDVKGRGAGGNILTKYPVRKIEIKSEGISTLSGLDIWYDKSVGRLNKDERGTFIGTFNGEDKILAVSRDGTYILTGYELTNRYEQEKVLWIGRFDPDQVISAVYYDGETKQHFVKRFRIETQTTNKPFGFISESPGSRLEVASMAAHPVIEIELIKGKGQTKTKETIDLSEIIDIKGWKATGNRLTSHKVKKVWLKQTEEQTESSKKEIDPVHISKRVAEEKQKEEVKESKSGPEIFDASKKESKTGKKSKGRDNRSETFGIGTTIELDF
ncbi:MAG: DNA gyrase/topoisomerase IV subunit A [Bacteroidetes bacterium]|nr:DNA gyrase/topoisomerase IV subunit A [Bacteroidota bacterium]